jgi:flagellar biosynthesis GTPase FlhF
MFADDDDDVDMEQDNNARRRQEAVDAARQEEQRRRQQEANDAARQQQQQEQLRRQQEADDAARQEEQQRRQQEADDAARQQQQQQEQLHRQQEADDAARQQKQQAQEQLRRQQADNPQRQQETAAGSVSAVSTTTLKAPPPAQTLSSSVAPPPGQDPRPFNFSVDLNPPSAEKKGKSSYVPPTHVSRRRDQEMWKKEGRRQKDINRRSNTREQKLSVARGIIGRSADAVAAAAATGTDHTTPNYYLSDSDDEDLDILSQSGDVALHDKIDEITKSAEADLKEGMEMGLLQTKTSGLSVSGGKGEGSSGNGEGSRRSKRIQEKKK